MKIAICILNWNGVALLQRFLPSIVKHSENSAIYVIDNGSTDDSVNWLKQHYPSVSLIPLAQNYGYAGGYNKGLKQIDADLYCLMNSDIRVDKGWLPPIQKAFAKDPNIAIAQPKIKQEKQSDFFEYAGAAGGFIDALGYPYCRGRILQHIERDKGQYQGVSPVFWASGACLFIRAEKFWALEGFDEDFFAHQEEIDLCWRAQNRGWGIWAIGDSEVFHLGGATLPQSAQKWYLNFRNSLWMLQKNLPRKQLISVLILRMIVDGLAGISFLFRGQFRNFWAVIRAHKALYAHWSKNQHKRKKQSTFIHPYFHVKSILWLYFVLKRSKFTDLPLDKRE